MVKYEKGFKNDKLGLELDIYEKDGREWFLAKDITDFLEYDATAQATRYLNDPELHSCMSTWHTAQGNSYQAMFIDEYALYEMMLRVTKKDTTRYEKAREFQKWVFGEILPLIRKNGAYVNVTKDDTPETIDTKIEAGAEEARRRYEQYQDEELASASNEIENLTARNDYLEDENSKLFDSVMRLKKIVKYFLDRDKKEFIIRNDIREVPTDTIKYKKFLQDITNRLVGREPIYKDVRVPDYYDREEDFYA